jgi:SpoVK/Ycf46/Vps4 family AAA+-type ATPase
MEDYKPTIAFKPGSKVKQEDKPDYSYWSDTLEMRRTKISTPERKEEDSPAVSDTDSRRDMDTPEYVRAADTEETGKPFRMRVEQPDAQTLPDQKERKKEFNTEMDIQALLKQLNELTGMQSVKTEINNMINLLKICKIRQENGLQTPPVTNHMVFLGNPGTGKTTVARILAKIYHGLGVLSKGHLVEVDRSGLVAGYMGQTSEKVTEVIEKAKGGILFIDEAYALANGQQGDFGQEAIDILNKAMEDNREDLIVIAAGYHDEMQDFLDANPGLRSRFNRTIEFPNYDAEELLEIMTNRAKSLDYTLTDDAVLNGKKLCGILTEMSAQIDYINYVVIGTGINVNQMEFPEEIAEIATSLAIETGHPVNRAKVVAAVLEAFEEDYEKFLEAGDLSGLKEAYEAVLANKDQPVRVLDPKEPFEGDALGITPTGELRVQKEDGTIVEVHSGEVSVRGLYSYV